MTVHEGVVRVLVDHPSQVRFLEAFESQRQTPRRWSVFVKIDAGGKCVQSDDILILACSISF